MKDSILATSVLIKARESWLQGYNMHSWKSHTLLILFFFQAHKWIERVLHCHIYSIAKLPLKRILLTKGLRSQDWELRKGHE